MGTTVGEELLREMARVRDEVMPAYREIGPAGAVALALMGIDLDEAGTAMAEGDVVKMIQASKSLQGWTV